MITIYVAGYPKSGTTWLTRLLGDALNCPTGGALAKEDRNEMASEGWDRKSDMIVRKGHFLLNDDPADVPVLRNHVLNWRGLTNDHKLVFIVRDPRDIVVSSAFYWRIPIDRALNNMVTGKRNFRFVKSWSSYVYGWLNRQNQFSFRITRYEDLLRSPMELRRIIKDIGIEIPTAEVIAAYNRQVFSHRVADILEHGEEYNLGKEHNLRLMRKGVSGEWRNYLEVREAEIIEKAFGDLMRLFHYTSDESWIRTWR